MRGQYWSHLSGCDWVAVSVEGEHDEAAVAAEADQHRHQHTVQPQRGHHLGLLPKYEHFIKMLHILSRIFYKVLISYQLMLVLPLSPKYYIQLIQNADEYATL